MPPTRRTKPGMRKLSDVARHLVLPAGIVSTGYPAVKAQCLKMGVVHDDWQQGLARAILAKRANGLYAAGVGGVFLSTCRQVGKTFTFGTVIFALCALNPGMTVLWTAHHTRTSDETFEALAGMARRPQIAPFIGKPTSTGNGVMSGNGKQSIHFKNGSRILFGAREQGFGRGIPGVSVVVFDEAQILKQGALNDMVPAANTVKNPLILYMGTPPDPKRLDSEVFKARRKKMLKFPHCAAAGNALYIELGADPGADLEDRAQWAKGNPSYPARTPEESMLRLREQLNDDEAFCREGLGIWDDEVAPNAKIPPKAWADLGCGMNITVTGMKLAVDVRTGLEQSFAVAVVGDTMRKGVQVPVGSLAAYETGTGRAWGDRFILDAVLGILEHNGLDSVVIDAYGDGNGVLIPQLEELGIEVVKLNTTDMRNGAVGLSSAVINGQVLHVVDPASDVLDVAVAGAGWRTSGNGFVWSQAKSSVDITALRAFTAAWWAHHLEADYDVADSFY